LRSVLAAFGREAEGQSDLRGGITASAARSPVVATSRPAPDEAGAAPAQAEVRSPGRGVLLPFPIRGEALLVKLAGALQNRVEKHGSDRDPLLLTMSRCPRSRLSIDRAAYVEFYDERSEYSVVVESSTGTRVIVETADFDAAVEFIAQYVAARFVAGAAFGVAS
jgi:hypothetical protein